MLWTKLVRGLLAGVILLTTAGAAEHCTKTACSADDAKSVAAAFGRLKELVGDWRTTSPKDDADKTKVAVRYHLTAGGSAVVETLFPGEDMEMVTVYHRDGDQLMMTHYCQAGNQPRMRTKSVDDTSELVFDFAGGTNLDPAKDLHMHGYRVRFVDSNHLQARWEYYRDGKSAGKHEFDLVRIK